jgi:hypothetical protein
MSSPAGPAATARFGNITLSAGFGLFPSLFGFHLHGFPESSGGLGGAGAPGIHLGSTATGMSSMHPAQQQQQQPPVQMPNQQQEALLSRLLILLGCFVIICLLLF